MEVIVKVNSELMTLEEKQEVVESWIKFLNKMRIEYSPDCTLSITVD